MIPSKDWGTLGKIRGITTRPLRMLLTNDTAKRNCMNEDVYVFTYKKKKHEVIFPAIVIRISFRGGKRYTLSLVVVIFKLGPLTDHKISMTHSIHVWYICLHLPYVTINNNHSCR